MRSRRWLVAFLFLVPVTLDAVQGKEKFTALHVAKIRTVVDAKISPDGQSVAYVLSVPRDLTKEEDGRAWAELHVVDLKRNSRPFVTGDVNVSSISWAPDGKSIFFLAKRNGDENVSLYQISISGGEAKKVLSHSTSIDEYSFKSDGKTVAFIATEPDSEEVKKLKDKGFTQEIYEEDVKVNRLWIANLDKPDADPTMFKLPGHSTDLHWAPKGDLLALALAPHPLIDSHYMFRRVRVVDATTGKITAKLDNPGKLGDIAWSSDASHLAIISGVDMHDPREGRIWVTKLSEGKWKDLTPDHPGHVSSIVWNGKHISYLSQEGVWTALGTKTIAGKNVPPSLPTGLSVFHTLSIADNGTLAMLGETPQHPLEVYFYDGKVKQPVRLTFHNPWLKDMEFAKQEVITHVARDGLKLEGILIRPLNEQKGTRYPLVLTVHGGPESHVPNGWITSYSRLGQVGAAEGFAVFYPNYRGSTGRGLKFSKMGQEDAAGKEFDDLVDAVDHLIATGLVDKKKVGITGGSYGGYATAWGSTYYSDRFAAGVMFVGISDNVSKVGTTDIPYEMYLVHHMKWLWEDWDYFKERSPIYHIKKAKTPLLIMHGKNDPRVHPSQSMELYRHLKVRAKAPVRLVLYPGEGHGNRRAASRLDYNLRMLRWMKHFLQKDAKQAPPLLLKPGLDKK